MGKSRSYQIFYKSVIADIILHVICLLAIILLYFLNTEANHYANQATILFFSALITAFVFLFARRKDVRGTRVSVAIGAVYSIIVFLLVGAILDRSGVAAIIALILTAILVVRATAFFFAFHKAFKRYCTVTDLNRMAAQEDAIMEARLHQLVHDWEKSGRHESYLIRGTPLQRMQKWAETRPVPDHVRAFFQESSNFASIGNARRLGALIVDIILAGLITVTLFAVSLGSVPSIPWFLLAAVGFLIIIGVIGNRIGRTPGMWLSGLVLASADGSKITWRQAVLRVILIGFPRKDAITRTTVLIAPPSTEKPLALRAIIQLSVVNILFNVLIIGAIIHGTGPRPPVAEGDHMFGFLQGLASEALKDIGHSADFYDAETANRASGPYLISGIFSFLILVVVRLRAPTAITILSALSILLAGLFSSR